MPAPLLSPPREPLEPGGTGCSYLLLAVSSLRAAEVAASRNGSTVSASVSMSVVVVVVVVLAAVVAVVVEVAVVVVVVVVVSIYSF